MTRSGWTRAMASRMLWAALRRPMPVTQNLHAAAFPGFSAAKFHLLLHGKADEQIYRRLGQAPAGPYPLSCKAMIGRYLTEASRSFQIR